MATLSDTARIDRICLVGIAIDAALHMVGQDVPDWLRIELCKAVDDLFYGAAQAKNARDAGVDALLGEFVVAHAKNRRVLFDPTHNQTQVCLVGGCGHTYAQHFDPANNNVPGCLSGGCTCLAFREV